MRRPFGVSITGASLQKLKNLSEDLDLPTSRVAEAFILSALRHSPEPTGWPIDPRFVTNFSVDVAIVPAWQDLASRYHNGKRFLLSWLVADPAYTARAVELLREHPGKDWERLIRRVCGGASEYKITLTTEQSAELERLSGEESAQEWLSRMVDHAIFADRRQADGARTMAIRLSVAEQGRLHASRREGETEIDALLRLVRAALD